MNPEWIQTKSGLEYYDFRKSDGPPVKVGQSITVHYKVVNSEDQFDDGPWLDNSWKTQKPIKFKIGRGQILKGLDEGIIGMRVAGYRRFRLPAHLAFGGKGVPGLIEPNTSLVVEVYVIQIND